MTSARSEGQRLRWARRDRRGKLTPEQWAELRAIVIAQHDVIERIDRLCAATTLSRSELFAASPPSGNEQPKKDP